jgi:hypothetical protein
MIEAQVEHMVNRFLGWKLPENFNPDAGISYTRPNYPASHPGPIGTNLFDAMQADAMVRYMLEGAPSTVGETAHERAEMLLALKLIVAQIEDYERVNNLAPNPGRKHCWDSVAQAHAIIAKAESRLLSAGQREV